MSLLSGLCTYYILPGPYNSPSRYFNASTAIDKIYLKGNGCVSARLLYRSRPPLRGARVQLGLLWHGKLLGGRAVQICLFTSLYIYIYLCVHTYVTVLVGQLLVTSLAALSVVLCHGRHFGITISLL